MNENNTDANPTPAPAPSAAAEPAQAPAQNPPAEGNTAVEAKQEKSVPYTRFQEVISEKNSANQEKAALLKRIEELESRYSSQEQPKAPSMMDKVVEKFRAKGLDEDTARVLAETQIEVSQELVDARMAPIESKNAQDEMNSMLQTFSSKHQDYADVEPAMYELFKHLPEQTQQMIVSDLSGTGLELLYSKAKMSGSDASMDQKFQEGVKAGYDNKQAKSAVSSASGSTSSVNTIPSRKEIAEMSLEEYKAKRDMILKNQGSLA